MPVRSPPERADFVEVFGVLLTPGDFLRFLRGAVRSEFFHREDGRSATRMIGIYKFEKGQLTVCFAPPGKERPKEFSIKVGTGDFIHVWKKKAKD